MHTSQVIKYEGKEEFWILKQVIPTWKPTATQSSFTLAVLGTVNVNRVLILAWYLPNGYWWLIQQYSELNVYMDPCYGGLMTDYISKLL